jgi:hypothetical protein
MKDDLTGNKNSKTNKRARSKQNEQGRLIFRVLFIEVVRATN